MRCCDDATTQVVRAIDLQKDDAEVAIKIIKARTPYAIQAKREIEVTTGKRGTGAWQSSSHRASRGSLSPAAAAAAAAALDHRTIAWHMPLHSHCACRARASGVSDN
jgi:hypothetical protein